MPNGHEKGPSGPPAKRSTPARGSRFAQALRVPTGLYGVAGNWKVEETEKGMEGLYGQQHAGERTIRVHPNQHQDSKVQTLGHELMHGILWDSGLHYLLTEKMQEALCDAFGTWMVGACRAGMIVLKDPPRNS